MCCSCCQTCTMLIGSKTNLIFLKSNRLLMNSAPYFRNSSKIRCILVDQFTPTFTVSSSLASAFVSGNAITAAAAAVSGSSSAHAAVTSAITQLAVSAIAIASGACLSTKVDFLWPKVNERPGSLVLDGVDVTGLPIFNDEKVQKAIAFARKAHYGQLRKTGESYLTHCIHTGKILALLVPPTGKRAIDTVVAGILHDVIDDTCESLDSIEREFGTDVAKLVAGVSRLSYINQLLRRHRRLNVNQAVVNQEEANSIRVMLLGMVDDPRVVLIKLADRLHNMRTIYALPLIKAQAVAQETLAIWCSLASRLGLWALKAELEDLCFAVLQPHIYRRLRAELAAMWSHTGSGRLRRLSSRSGALVKPDCLSSVSEYEKSTEVLEPDVGMEVLLQAVLPFDLLLDRRKRIEFVNNLSKGSEIETKPKIIKDAHVALASLVVCEDELERELFISTSYVPGMEVTLSSRLKSLYSIYAKMKRKDIDISRVYDSRALRVVVGDKRGAFHGQAVQCCYNLLSIVHRLWTPIDGELDDYIVNPKTSGYQSLHTAVRGSDNSPLEIQIRTQRMHEYAEHGLAAHWLYKETDVKLTHSITVDPENTSSKEEGQVSTEDGYFRKYSSLKPGHPVLRVEAGHLLAAVIIRIDKDGRELLVAVSFGLAASEAVADRRSNKQLTRWEAYAGLYKKVSNEWWCEPGHGDWCTNLERYTLCQDGMYHKQDQFERLLPTFIQIIELTEQEEREYWAVVSAVLEGKPVDSAVSPHSVSQDKQSLDSSNSTLMTASINNKVLLLRTMLQWEEELRSEAGGGLRQQKDNYRKSNRLGEVVIVSWPDGEMMRLRSGSTAADAAMIVGLEGKLVSVNGRVVIPSTELKDGDVVEVRNSCSKLGDQKCH